LVLRWPARWPKAHRVTAPVQLVDLAPTLLRLAGVSSLEGVWANPGLESQVAANEERPIFLYRRHYAAGSVRGGLYAAGEKFGVRLGRWKLIEGPEEETLELFDLAADPAESVNLVDRDPRRAADLLARLHAWKAPYRSAPMPGAGPDPGSDRESDELTDADRARLRALGYVE
jgi:arylsulfatase A-like enzyme